MRKLQLNSRGISHVILPMLIVVGIGVAGAFTLVSSHANGGSKGYLVVYNDTGIYNHAKVVLTNTVNTAQKKYVCGGKLDSQNTIIKTFTDGANSQGNFAPKTLLCSAIAGDSAYNVYFGKNDLYTEKPVVVDVDPGYCTIVHADPTLTRKIHVRNGKCEASAADSPGAAGKVNVGMSVFPQLSNDKKSIVGYADVFNADPKGSVTNNQCTGQVTITYVNQTTGVTYTQAFPLKFIAHSKTKARSYCTARMTAPQLTAGTYQLRGDEAGTNFLNVGGNSAQHTIKITDISSGTGTAGSSGTNVPAKRKVQLSVSPSLSEDKKHVMGQIKVVDPSGSISAKECNQTVNLTYVGQNKVYPTKVKLKFVPTLNASFSSCTASFNTPLNPGVYGVKVDITDSAVFSDTGLVVGVPSSIIVPQL